MRCSTCGKDNPIRITRCQVCGGNVTGRPRRASAAGLEDGWSLTPQQSLGATAYRYGLLGLIPVVGLVLGPLALLRGFQGLRLGQVNVGDREISQALAGVVLGGLEILTNSVGLVLLSQGLTNPF